jgi:hypothetical protein
MEVTWRQEKHTYIFEHQSSIFPVTKLVQGLVIKYDNIFQALAVEGDILLMKPLLKWLLDLSFDGVIR